MPLLPLLSFACAPSPEASFHGAGSSTMAVGETPGPVDSGGESSDSRCVAGPGTVSCPYETTGLATGWPAYDPREVHWQVPLGEPPTAGWPAVLLFQGSFFSAELSWSGTDGDPIGLYPQALLVQALLDGGWAVITPEAKVEGGISTFWDTNVLPWSLDWDASPDAALMDALFAAIAAGTFGPVNSDALYAGGISSGGYMTSRMAVSYGGRFRALAIESASYATCDGWLCTVPPLPADHPPTLFLHGGADAIVPLDTMLPYASALILQGTPMEKVIDPAAGHEWLSTAPVDVPAFFADHG